MGHESSSLVAAASHLDWFPDETLYSLASRHHRISGNHQPQRTAQQLFGHRRGGYPHDLPAGLDHFVAVTDGRLGDASTIARQRTIFPLLLLFRTPDEKGSVLAAMRSPRIGGAKSRLGLPASRMGSFCPLKACLACMSEDQSVYGTPFWRRAHQIPGAFFCLIHQERLRTSAASAIRSSRFDWMLPVAADMLANESIGSSLDENADRYRLRLTRMAVEASASSEASVDEAGLAAALSRGMAGAGWLNRSGRINRSLATGGWMGALSAIEDASGLSDPRITESGAYSQIHSLLASPAKGHVLRPLALAALLFPNWGALVSATLVPKDHEVESSDGDPNDTMAPARALVVQAVAHGRSVSAAATVAGVSVKTAQSWLASAGVAAPTRPKKLDGKLLDDVLTSLRDGQLPGEVASRYALSLSSIHRVLSTTVGLRSQWASARDGRVRSEAREQWSDALSNAGSAGPKAARTIQPRAYAWLYRNDREWLLAANALAALQSRGNNASVDWDARDRFLAQACREAILALAGELPNRPPRLIDIIRRVPELRTKLHRIESLPLTEGVLRLAQVRRRTKRGLLP